MVNDVNVILRVPSLWDSDHPWIPGFKRRGSHALQYPSLLESGPRTRFTWRLLLVLASKKRRLGRRSMIRLPSLCFAKRQGQKNFLRQVPSESAQIIWEVQQLRAEIWGWSAWVEVSAQQAAKKWNFPSPSCTLLLITGWKSCANSQSCNKNMRNEPFSPKKKAAQPSATHLPIARPSLATHITISQSHHRCRSGSCTGKLLWLSMKSESWPVGTGW